MELSQHEKLDLIKSLFEFEDEAPEDEELLDHVKIHGTTLKISENLGITKIRPTLATVVWMTELHIEDNSIEEVPECIGQLTQLRSVSFPENFLTRLPESFANLKHLKWVDLSKNRFSEIPPVLERCPRLVFLSLCGNQSKGDLTFPPTWKCMRGLNLAECGLSSIPDSIAHISGLVQLQLKNNPLGEIPQAIRHLQRLEYLYIEQCQITDLPDWFGGLRRMKKLDLSGNPLEEIPSAIRKLKRLQKLIVSRCRLSELPKWLEELPIIIHLDLSGNMLGKIPSPVRQLKNLLILNVNTCGIRKLPDWLGELQGLLCLDVETNDISQLPPCIGALKSLKILKISRNNIEEIPKYVAMLPQLRFVHSDPLEHFPPAFMGNSNFDIIVEQYENARWPSEPWEMAPPANQPQPIIVQSARRLGLEGKESLCPGDVPSDCLELVQSARECSTPGCSGIFVKGGGREAIIITPYLSNVSVPFYFTTCHPSCSQGSPMNWPMNIL